MTSTISILPDYDAPQIAINDIGSEEDFLAAIDATMPMKARTSRRRALPGLSTSEVRMNASPSCDVR